LTVLRALLANEAGGGRGHITTLVAAAHALGSDFARFAAVGRLNYASELEGLCQSVVKAPLLARQKTAPRIFGVLGSATWGDVLAEIGLEDPARVARGLAFWRDMIVSRDISLLIADFAPLALRAALGLRDEGWAIRIVNIGTGYTSPPAHLPRFPIFLDDHDRITRSEDETVAILNGVGAASQLAPLPRLPALYDVDLPLATTFDFLDPYPDRPAACRIPPLVPASTQLAGNGDGVFVYFSTAELTDDATVSALETLNLPRRGFLPSASPEVRARLAASGMELLDRPATADEIAAYARLIVHAAPHGTLCLAALAGLPQFGIPQHLEQLFNARRAETAGIMHVARRGDPDLCARMAAAYADAALLAQARAVAERLRADHPADPIAALGQRLRPELEAAALA
jgi:hypothetical protein